jgi:hypothetical protein
MREWVKLARVQCLSPMQSSLAKQTSRQLLSDFVSQRRRFRVFFDTSEVPGFQEDENAAADRVLKMVSGGVLRVDRGQAALGLEVDETQKVYLRPSNTTPVDENGDPVNPPPADGGQGGDVPPAVLARVNGNGNGNGGAA